VVCNVAGVGRFTFDEETTLEEWDRVLRVNLIGTWLVPGLGRPEEVAAAIAFLASPDASHGNGHVLTVDGGKRAWPLHLAQPARRTGGSGSPTPRTW
jgi:NAD(P)-dependent dehydrogenase (short-subunit alcohol dehydrogenase family)